MIPERHFAVWGWPAPVDLRKGFNGLLALVEGQWGHDLMRGDFYLFVARHRRSCKVLHYDGTGLCVLAKRLATGQFARLWPDKPGEAIDSVLLTPSEYLLFMEGCEVVGRMALSPPRQGRKAG